MSWLKRLFSGTDSQGKATQLAKGATEQKRTNAQSGSTASHQVPSSVVPTGGETLEVSDPKKQEQTLTSTQQAALFAPARHLYVWHDRDLGMDAAQGVARQVFKQGSLSEHAGVFFNPVDPSWFDDYTGQAGAQLMIDYCNYEGGFVAPQVKRELVFMKSPMITFTWKGKADFKDCFVVGFTIKLGSTDPYEVWNVKDIFPPDQLERTKSAEDRIRSLVEENIELRETRVWCNFCHRMCYLMVSGFNFHYDDLFELAGFHGMTASVCKSCNAHICGGCLVALSMMEKARQVCPHCGKANWTGRYTIT